MYWGKFLLYNHVFLKAKSESSDSRLSRVSSESNLNRVIGGSSDSSERIVSCESSVNSVSSFGSLGGSATSICDGNFWWCVCVSNTVSERISLSNFEKQIEMYLTGYLEEIRLVGTGGRGREQKLSVCKLERTSGRRSSSSRSSSCSSSECNSSLQIGGDAWGALEGWTSLWNASGYVVGAKQLQRSILLRSFIWLCIHSLRIHNT